MNQKQIMALTAHVMRDETPLPIITDIKSAWLIVSALQLAVRHPELSVHMRVALTAIAHQYQGAITDLHPEAEQLLEMGWNPANDRQ